MNEILNYFLEHKLLAFILIVASVAHVWGFANLFLKSSYIFQDGL